MEMRDRRERLAAGFWICGERDGDYPVITTAHVRLRRAGMDNLELTPEEAVALADALRAEAMFASKVG